MTPVPIESDFDVNGQLAIWSGLVGIKFEEIVAYFGQSNSYLVRAKSGMYYLSKFKT